MLFLKKDKSSSVLLNENDNRACK